MERVRVGIVGVGKIARDRHIPAIAADASFVLGACVARHDGLDGVPTFRAIEDTFGAVPTLDAVSICTPPQTHFPAGQAAKRVRP